MESGNRLTFNYNIEFPCWECYGECEGVILRKLVGQIQSDLHICKLGMFQKEQHESLKYAPSYSHN